MSESMPRNNDSNQIYQLHRNSTSIAKIFVRVIDDYEIECDVYFLVVDKQTTRWEVGDIFVNL